MSIRRATTGVMLLATMMLAGCHSKPFEGGPGMGPYADYVQQIEYPDVAAAAEQGSDLMSTPPPPSVRNPAETEKRMMTLEEAIEIALANSEVIRSIGGQVVNAAAAAPTIFDPAIQETDPRSGVEAALSQFDADLATSLFFDRQERTFNNFFQGAGANSRSSNLGDFRLGITKVAPTGTQFSLENITTYNRNNAPSNVFSSAYDTTILGTFRQPLLQGGGVEFNRIAGPQSSPGNYNGVLLARISSDTSLADFELAVRDLVRDVERTYWELFYAYRNLDALMSGRQLALESWRLEKTRAESGFRDTPPDQEAFARQQYYAAQILVENALTGTSAGTGGVYAVERQLRLLLGLPTSDGQLIAPATAPVEADVRFDWYESIGMSLTRRAELRKQQWAVKRRELELVAARNFTRMRLDVVGQYDWRGFGDDLFGNRGTQNGSAFQDLFTGELQEWRFGLELTTPVGNRIGHAAQRNAELRLMREQAVLNELEQQLLYELNGAFTELDRAFVVTRSTHNRRVATFIRLRGERARNTEGKTRLDLVLDAQRQAVDAETQYYRALVDYNLALVDIHNARGTLLDNHRVRLSEGPWTIDAHRSAHKQSRRFRYQHHDTRTTTPADVSRGVYDQEAG